MNIHNTAQMIIALQFLRKEKKNTGVEIYQKSFMESHCMSFAAEKKVFFKIPNKKIILVLHWKSCFSIRNLNFVWSLIFLCYKRVSNLQFRTVDFFNGQIVSLFLFAVSLLNLKQGIFIQYFASIFKTFFQLKKKISTF